MQEPPRSRQSRPHRRLQSRGALIIKIAIGVEAFEAIAAGLGSIETIAVSKTGLTREQRLGLHRGPRIRQERGALCPRLHPHPEQSTVNF